MLITSLVTESSLHPLYHFFWGLSQFCVSRVWWFESLARQISKIHGLVLFLSSTLWLSYRIIIIII